MNIRFSTLFIVLATLFVSTQIVAQQFPYMSGIENTRHIWNPAAIQAEDNPLLGLYARQQWVSIGFDKAPRFVNASIQYPFEDYNMSGGLALFSETSGPLSNTGVTLNYAYHLNKIFGRYSRLSGGISASFNSFGFDPSDESYRDEGDPLLIASKSNAFYPSIGGGIYYKSSTRDFKDNSLELGISAYHAYSTNLLIQSNNFERQLHIYGFIGTNLVIFDGMFSPSLSVNYTNPEIIDMALNATYEQADAFWLGAGFSTVNDLFMQGGLIIPDFSGYGSELRLGVMANMNITSSIKRAGPSFELFVQYRFAD